MNVLHHFHSNDHIERLVLKRHFVSNIQFQTGKFLKIKVFWEQVGRHYLKAVVPELLSQCPVSRSDLQDLRILKGSEHF